MGKGKTSSKAALKKKERLELQKKMDARVLIVKAANQQEDPLDTLPSFRRFCKGDLIAEISAKKVANLDETTKDWVMDLTSRNMKSLYEKSHWGWNEANKKKELFDDAAWYLLAKREVDGKLMGFAHFRFDMDFDDEVLYIYEIQLEEEFQRKGLGRFMMQVLEVMSFKADMRKIMLTVFKHNPEAEKFFRSVMKFETDETSPVDDVYEQFDYEILGKFNKRKLAREQQQENDCTAANAIKAISINN